MKGPMLVAVLLMTSCVDGQPYRGCPAGPICYTKSCIYVAAELLASMDETVNPCDDFYHYACGHWIEHQFLTHERKSAFFRNTGLPIAATRNMLAESHKTTDLDAERKAKSLYASCLNHASGTTEDAAIVRAVTERFGRWPLACSDCNVTEYDLETFLIEATQIDVHPLFKLTIDPFVGVMNHSIKMTRRSLILSIPELGLTQDDYEDFSFEPEYRQIYADTIYAAAKRFGIDDHERAKQDAMEIVKIEEAFTKMLLYSSPLYHRKTLDSVNADFGQLMNWTRFVSTLASLPSVGITDIASNESVNIKSPEILKEIINYFLELPARTQVNYIIWSVVDSLQSVLIPVNDKLGVILEHAVSDDTSVPLRDEACVNFVSLAFHLVAHRRHYREHLSAEKIRTVDAILNQIKDEFYGLLTEHHWLDENSSQIVEEKIESITTEISYFRAAMNSTFLEAYYSNVSIGEKSFIDNVIAVRKDTFAKNLQTIRTHEKSHSPAFAENNIASIFQHSHEIYFTSNLLQAPWFVDNAPMSLNYAILGFVLGHEVSHAVDFRGVWFHKNGTRGMWFGEATTMEFTQRARCMIDQYNAYLHKPADMYVIGFLTINENIADNGGLKLAYRAYRNYTSSRIPQELKLPGLNFTTDQVFFLRFAQRECAKQSKLEAQLTVLANTHSPGEFRINGPLQNSQDFADAFGCPPGTPMNPIKKCQMW